MVNVSNLNFLQLGIGIVSSPQGIPHVAEILEARSDSRVKGKVD